MAEAHRHWEKEVYGCVSLRGLKAEGFEAGFLDMAGKGYLDIEDLMSFVTEYTACSVSRSELSLTYRRLKWQESGFEREGVTYRTFTRTVAI